MTASPNKHRPVKSKNWILPAIIGVLSVLAALAFIQRVTHQPAPRPTPPSPSATAAATPTQPATPPPASAAPSVEPFAPPTEAAPVAFPGAEGFGKDTPGGRGGQVIEVTNLNDSGPGSLRAAIEANGPRIVVFRVGGVIELESSLNIQNPFITIAGQTAPGGGITLKNSPSNTGGALIVETHDVILRYLRSRPGPPPAGSSNGDAIEINGPDAQNIIIDHCSFSWAIDEVVSTWYAARNITIQWSIISEGLNCSTHEKGCHSMGLILGSEGSDAISVHHNLFAHNGQRNPLIQTSGVVDVVNNVVFDAAYTPITVNDSYGKVLLNLVGNYYKQVANEDNLYFLSAASESGLGLSLFVQGNRCPTRPRDGLDEGACVKPKGLAFLTDARHNAPAVSTESAELAYEQVLARAGASAGLDPLGQFFERRDAVDDRVVQDVRDGLGRVVNDPAEVGGWPALAAGAAPSDADQDGMPDAWEERHSLNPNDPTDGPADSDGDGYTNIEEYLNGTNPLN